MAKFRPSAADPYPRVTYIGNPAASRPRDWQSLFRNVVADLPGVLAVGGPRPDHLRRRYPGNPICDSMPDALQFVIEAAATYYPDVDLDPLRRLLSGQPRTPDVLADAQVAAAKLASVVLRRPPATTTPPAPLAGPEPAVPDAPAVNARMTPRELASKYGVSFRALRGRLDRWRPCHFNGYIEISNPAKNEPHFLYDESAVMPVIDAMKRAADGQRKKI